MWQATVPAIVVAIAHSATPSRLPIGADISVTSSKGTITTTPISATNTTKPIKVRARRHALRGKCLSLQRFELRQLATEVAVFSRPDRQLSFADHCSFFAFCWLCQLNILDVYQILHTKLCNRCA